MKLQFNNKEFETKLRNKSNIKVGMTSPATKEKLLINMVIAKYELNKDKDVVIDPYASIGLSTSLWADNANKVIAIEKDEYIYWILKKNMENLGYKNVTTYNSDNLDYFKAWKSFGTDLKPKLIDLDPYANCHEQIPYALSLKPKLLFITTGEQFYLMRNNNQGLDNRYGDLLKEIDDFWDFPTKVLYPFTIMNAPPEIRDKIKLEHFYIYQTSARLLLSIDYILKPETVLFLRSRPKNLGLVAKKNYKNIGLRGFTNARE